MLDQQDSPPKTSPPDWFLPLMCFGIVLLISGWLDAAVVHRSGLITSGLVLLGGQILINSLFALLMYQRRHLALSLLAYISFGVWLIWILLYYYTFPASLAHQLDVVEGILDVTIVDVTLWHSFAVFFRSF
jgi:hypothetical protein